MANKDELKRKRELDRRAALLALAADRTAEKSGNCISSQEMAALLDGKCEAELHNAFLEHFSSCDSCYREWLELTQELAQEKRIPQKPLLFQRKFLTVSGSLLAAAASLVFYLNLDHAPGPQKVSAPAPVQMEMTTGVSEDIDPPLQQKRMKTVAPPSSSIRKVLPRTPDMESEGLQMSEERRALSTMDSMRMPAVDPLQQWVQQVEEKCDGLSANDVAWKVLALQGGKLVKAVQSSKLERIHELLGQIVQGREQESVCSEIKRILEENNDD